MLINDFVKATISNLINKNDSVLDIGAGYNKLMKTWGFNTTSIDIDEKTKPDIVADITKIKLKENQFDVIVAMDLIEHLDKLDGYRLLKNMEVWASKRVIVYTPYGYLKDDGHKSGWYWNDFKGRGYDVVRFGGMLPIWIPMFPLRYWNVYGNRLLAKKEVK